MKREVVIKNLVILRGYSEEEAREEIQDITDEQLERGYFSSDETASGHAERIDCITDADGHSLPGFAHSDNEAMEMEWKEKGFSLLKFQEFFVSFLFSPFLYSLRNEIWGEGKDRKFVIIDEVSEDTELTTNLRSGKWTLDADMDIFEDGEKICSAYSYKNNGGIWAIIPLERALKEGVHPDDAVPETMIGLTEYFYLNDEFKNCYGLDDKDIDLFRRSSLSEWDKVAEKLGLYRIKDKFLPICKVLRDKIRLTFTYDATEAEETMLDDEKKSKVRHRIYSLYQLDWMQRHNWSLQDLFDSMQDYITEEAIDGTLDQDLSHVVNTAFDNVLYDAGFKGSSEIFDTFWEFTETKAPDGRIVGGTYFSDPEYIKELCQIPGDGGELWELYCLDTEYEDILNLSAQRRSGFVKL